MGPCELENAVGKMAVLVFSDHPHAGSRVSPIPVTMLTVADVAGSRVMRHRMATMGSSTGPSLPERGRGCSLRRVRQRLPAADKSHAVGLIRDLTCVRPVHCHHMKHPRWLLVNGTGPAGCYDRPLWPDDLGLNEEVAKGRVECVCGGRRKDDFGVARDVDCPCRLRTVGKGDPAQLGIILWRYGDLRMGADAFIPAAELRRPFREYRLVLFGRLVDRLVRRDQ